MAERAAGAAQGQSGPLRAGAGRVPARQRHRGTGQRRGLRSADLHPEPAADRCARPAGGRPGCPEAGLQQRLGARDGHAGHCQQSGRGPRPRASEQRRGAPGRAAQPDGRGPPAVPQGGLRTDPGPGRPASAGGSGPPRDQRRAGSGTRQRAPDCGQPGRGPPDLPEPGQQGDCGPPDGAGGPDQPPAVPDLPGTPARGDGRR